LLDTRFFLNIESSFDQGVCCDGQTTLKTKELLSRTNKVFRKSGADWIVSCVIFRENFSMNIVTVQEKLQLHILPDSV